MSEEANKVSLETIFGQKAGMTRVFDQNGKHVPVTVIRILDNMVSQVKTVEKDGYNAYQVAHNEKRPKLVTRPTQGHLKKADIKKTFSRFTEVKVGDVKQEHLGLPVSMDEFKANDFVDVTGVSKGKGFQGVMKKFGFAGGPASHGSHFHRRPGSIGNRATPGKVFKQKKMPGQMGGKQVTTQNLEVVAVNETKGYLLLKGAVPGAKNSFVKISKAKKKSSK